MTSVVDLAVQMERTCENCQEICRRNLEYPCGFHGDYTKLNSRSHRAQMSSVTANRLLDFTR